MFFQRSKIVISGQTISPQQYAWLFPDLPQNANSASLHWSGYGKAEIRAFGRAANPERMAQIAIQKCSDYPAQSPSEFFRFKPPASDISVLNIIFTHAFVPRGHFAMSHVTDGSSGAVLFVSTQNNDWYQNGIPGVSGGLKDTASWLRRVVKLLGSTHVRCIGTSMGGYAALILGSLLGADEIISLDAEAKIGGRGTRSFEWNNAKVFAENFSDVSVFPSKSIKVLVSGCDPFEYKWVPFWERMGAETAFLNTFHGEARVIDWVGYFQNRERCIIQNFIDPQYLMKSKPDKYRVRAMTELHKVSAERRFERSASLSYELAADIPNLLMYAAVADFLNGDTKRAETAIQDMKALGHPKVYPSPLMEADFRFSASQEETNAVKERLIPILDQ